MGNVLLALQLILQNSQALQQWATLVNNAIAQGRDLTDEEMNSVMDQYTAAHAALDQLIAQKNAQAGAPTPAPAAPPPKAAP